MSRSNKLQKVFRLAGLLYPDKDIAFSVTQDACDRISLLRKVQKRRNGAYRLIIPEKDLAQFCVYQASNAREQSQRGKNLKYQQNLNDFLIHYIKFLLWQTMERKSRYVAVGLGCFLYTYRPGEIAKLSPDFFDEDNIRRVKRWINDQIKSAYNIIGTRIPTPQELQVIEKSLTAFVPWSSPHVPSDALDTDTSILLEEYFNKDSHKSELERIHALIDPKCAGFPRLIREYNNYFPKDQLDDPYNKLRIPIIANGSCSNNSSSPDPYDLFAT